MDPKIEFISTGNELMTGTTPERNFSWIAERLLSAGVVASFHSSVGDDPDHIEDVLRNAARRADVVIVSGGLGPTEDDITASVASRFFGEPMVFNPSEFELIEKKLEMRGRKPASLHRKLATFPKGSDIIENEAGVAPGFRCNFQGKPFYFLPGVPSEFRKMVSVHVLPGIINEWGLKGNVSLRVLRTIGLGESEVAGKLRGLDSGDVNIGYRLYFPEVHIRLMSKGKERSEADEHVSHTEKLIRQRLGDYVYATGDNTLEQTVGGMLIKSGISVATAESCTGGLLASTLTDVPGSSAYFTRGVITYSNESKTQLLNVPGNLLKRHGAVSREVVESMASGIKRLSGADIGVGISGIAGPGGGTPEKPVGTVCIGVASEMKGMYSEKFRFFGSRSEIKLITTSYALNIIRNILINIV